MVYNIINDVNHCLRFLVLIVACVCNVEHTNKNQSNHYNYHNIIISSETQILIIFLSYFLGIYAGVWLMIHPYFKH